MRIGSLFSGIGGLELGLEMSGLGRVVWQVEQNMFCRQVLAKHWPHAERFEDVRKFHGGEPVDLICGGFPCQDISSAGKGAGLAGERSGLWFEFARVVGELRPTWVVVENVASGARRWVDAVCAGLGQQGYATLPVPLSAKNVGAPHLRRRIFVIAHANGEQLRQQQGRRFGASGSGAIEPAIDGETRLACDGSMARLRGAASGAPLWPAPPEFRGMDDGVPNRVDRLRALGNAVVPQCAEVIGWMIREMEALKEDAAAGETE